MYQLDQLKRLVDEQRPRYIFVVDNCVLMNNRAFDKWSVGFRSIYVIPDVVELEIIMLSNSKKKAEDTKQKADEVIRALTEITDSVGVAIGEGVPVSKDGWLVIVSHDKTYGHEPFEEGFKNAFGWSDLKICQCVEEIRSTIAGVPVCLLTNDIGFSILAATRGLRVHRSPSPFSDPSLLSTFSDKGARPVPSLLDEVPATETVAVEFTLVGKEWGDVSFVAYGEGVVTLLTGESLDFRWELPYWPYLGPIECPSSVSFALMPVEYLDFSGQGRKDTYTLKRAIAATLEACASPLAGTGALAQLKTLQDFKSIVEWFTSPLAGPRVYELVGNDRLWEPAWKWDIARLDEELAKIPQEKWGSQWDSKQRSEIMKGRARFGHFLLDRALDVWRVGETIEAQVAYRPYELP